MENKEIFMGVEIYQMKNGDFTAKGFWRQGSKSKVKAVLKNLLSGPNYIASERNSIMFKS